MALSKTSTSHTKHNFLDNKDKSYLQQSFFIDSNP